MEIFFFYAMNALILISLSIFTVLFRWAPHPANFTPVAALVLLSFAIMPRTKAALITAATMLVSDALIGFYEWQMMVAVYGSLLVIGFLGSYLRQNASVRRIVCVSMLGATIFFLVTNFAVWFFGTMYVHTWNGLAEAYVMAIPFFRSALIGDIFWSVIFFGAYERLRKRSMAPPELALARVLHRS